MIIGTALGTLSIIPFPLGLIFALPAIVLMIYVLIQSLSVSKNA